MISLNTYVRTQYPSQYCPARAMKDGIMYSPVTARVIATCAETMMYWTFANWIQQPFWGHTLGWVVLIGESLCWSHVYFQSELIGNIEDTVWATHGAYSAFYSNSKLSFLTFAIFATYSYLINIPRMAKRAERPFIRSWNGVKVQKLDKDTVAWQAPMLLVMPLVVSFGFIQINESKGYTT